jgi:hypothetical protein
MVVLVKLSTYSTENVNIRYADLSGFICLFIWTWYLFYRLGVALRKV